MTRIRNVGGKIIETTGGKEIYYAKESIVYNAKRKISFTAKEGTFFGEPESPNVTIKEAEYKLESTYAHDQLSQLATELAEMPFMFCMLEIFGYEIEISALSKLYRDLSDKKIQNPEIIVSQIPVNGKNAGYSNKRKKIIVYQKFIEDAVKDNDKSAELLAALVEEYGHHIDNLLRTELAIEGKPDNDVIDEGAKFAYALFKFDIFKESSLNYAKTEMPTYKGDLKVDFSKLHTEITRYVDENEQYDEVPGTDISNFGAGRNRKLNKDGAFAHGDIEFESLVSKELFDDQQVSKIYYGNWLRDFSQLIVGISVRGANAAIKLQKNKVVQEAMPMKLSHETWVSLMEILAIKEFIYDPAKEAGHTVTDNFIDLKKKFDNEFGSLTKDVLGIYRPEEHIDNPKGLEDESQITDDKGKAISFNYNGKSKTLYAGDNKKSWSLDASRNMLHYFWTDYPERPAAVTYMKEQIILACQKGKTSEGFRDLGAGLHVLEDYFAHTNFTEISLIKNGASMVYPWVQDKQGKASKEIPIVSGTFLTEDTFASVGPKAANLLFDPKVKDYQRRIPKQRTLSEMFIVKVLQDLAKGQKSDTAKKNPSYMGVEFSTWLNWFTTYLSFQDFMAAEYIKADKLKWKSKDFAEKLGAKALEAFSKSMDYTSQVMSFFPKVVFNIVLSSFETTVPEAQSHLNKNYGNCPSHSQIAKDSYSHPLNKLSATLAKKAVKDVGAKFKEGWDGKKLADYTADKYFVHPNSKNADWSDEIVKNWRDQPSNKKIIDNLKYDTIYEHAHHEAQQISQETLKKIKEVMDYFKKNSK
ncbi:hypothetical protein EYY60_10590 [Flavobacterium zhairuonense]|uniref:HET-C-related protein n=1 Tax=Flavobacterium zhairuonense TaxID=2493631 RepID=UPI001045644B|nr:HET-C-related protein [Flavobacterium zhairuonense]KAF2509961.1 hypothetical protein EYY60_10590 [Flavobacterium zhairuonense]